MCSCKSLLLVGLLAIAPGSAESQSHSAPAAVVSARQSSFKELGKSAKLVTVELRRADPDQAVLVAHSTKVLALARQLGGWFPQGTAGPALETDARNEIWLQPKSFTQATRQFQSAAASAARTARSGSIAAFKGEWKKVAATCKSCHDSFRS